MQRIRSFIVFFLILCMMLPGSLTLSAQCSGPLTTLPYNEDFEASNGGWIPGGTSSDWAWGTPSKSVISSAAAGVKCWITGGLNGSSYNNGENSWLQSPCFDFSTAVHPLIKFSVFWEMEKKYDGASMEYSTNDGASWQLLGSSSETGCSAIDWYNNSSITYLGGSQGWSGNKQPNTGSCLGGNGSNNWVIAQHDLSFLAGTPKVIFRFRFGAGTTCNGYDGFAIDEISISEALPNTAEFTYTCTSNRNASFISNAPLCAAGYQWDFGDLASGANNNSALANPNHIFSAPGLYHIILNITFLSGPPATVNHDFIVLDASINLLSAVLCNGDQSGALAAMVSGGGAGGYTYLWNTIPAQTSSSIINIPAGNYTVTINTANACPTDVSYLLTEPAIIKIDPTITPAQCNQNNGSITTTISGGVAPYQYSWSNGNTSAAINNVSPGTYALTIRDANGCTSIKNNLVIANNQNVIPVSLGRDTGVCNGQTVLLNPGTYSSYRWQDFSTGPTFTVTRTGSYWVTVTDANGCSGSDTINITVDCSDLFFPMAITPNGDKLNDDFGALGNLTTIKDFSLRIYDRYGQLIFYSTNPYVKWNGTIKGHAYNSGAFGWFSTYTLPGKPARTQKGTVLLLR